MAEHEHADDGGGAAATFMTFAAPIALIILWVLMLVFGWNFECPEPYTGSMTPCTQ